jgi:VanZ family protein
LLKPSFRSLLRNWWPVVVWLGVIRVESTDMASAANTSGLLYTVISAVAPHIDSAFVDRLDEVLRKTGHFVGYGILSALVVLALQRTNRDRLRDLLKRPWGIYLRDLWRAEWSVIAVLVTIATAALDEIHQSFIPSRTSRWQDVVLDTFGAMVVQLLIYWLVKRKLKRGAPPSRLCADRARFGQKGAR